VGRILSLALTRASTIAILLALAALPGLAHASPPDPSWIPGLYDNGDFDDVVVLVASATGTLGPDVLADLRPILPVIGHAPTDHADVTDTGPRSLDLARAPPAR